MRYTTIIDMTATPELYKCVNARLVYLHLCLIAGYHDYDRDIAHIGLRTLAEQVGITFSAVRHAIKLLERYHYIERSPLGWKVTKWLPSEQPTPRPKKVPKKESTSIAAERDTANLERERAADLQRQERERLHAQGKTSYMLYYESRLEQANNGDLEAAAWCEHNRKIYESQQSIMAAEKSNK